VDPKLEFTVLLPVWRRDDAKLLRLALESVFANSCKPSQTIVCADGALTTDLNTVLSEYPVMIVRNSGPNFGLHHNLNHALASVSTPWLARADADDINLPQRFEHQVKAIEQNPSLDVIGTDLIEVAPDGGESVKRMPAFHEQIVRMAPFRCPVNHNTTFVRAAAIRRAGGYPNVPRREDYALWLRMLAQGCRFGNLAEPLVRMTLGADFYSRRSGLSAIRSELAIGRFRRELPEVSHLFSLGVTTMRIGSMMFGPAVIKPVYRLMRQQARIC
jgi:glycosyltransferase involved in cell wall biosynthesis